jgi:hypothetical protein
MDGFLKSDFMADGSPLYSKIAKTLNAHGCQIVQGFRTFVENVLIPAGGSSFSIRDARDEVVKALADQVISEDDVFKVNELALLTADSLLLQQVHYLHAVLSLAIMLAKAEVVVRDVLTVPKMSSRAISEMQADG